VVNLRQKLESASHNPHPRPSPLAKNAPGEGSKALD